MVKIINTPNQINMICPNCVKEIKENVKFCGFCGQKIIHEKLNDDKYVNVLLATKPKWLKSGMFIIALVSLILIFLLVIYLIDNKDWKHAKQLYTIESFEEYIDTHPNGRYKEMARSKLFYLKIKERKVKKNKKKEAAKTQKPTLMKMSLSKLLINTKKQLKIILQVQSEKLLDV